MAQDIRDALVRHLDELGELSREQLLEARQRRIAGFGQFRET
jgi:acetyl-CoA carboxylase alpha subunit